MELAPIIVFAYNRPDLLGRTLDALSKNELAENSDLFIYCDGPKELTSDRIKELGNKRVKDYLSKIEESRKVAHAANGFKSVVVVEREKNIGLKANIVSAVTEIVNKYGRVIVIEDDIVTSPGFLRFMNEALEIYKEDERVMHISGYMWPHRWPLPETFFYQAPCPWGWATWNRAWKYYSDNTAELYEYWKTRWDEFNSFGGSYLQQQLEENYSGKLNTWYVKWHAVMRLRNALALYPGQSLVDNRGFGEDATNCNATDKFDVQLADKIEIKRRAIRESRLAAHEIYAFYQGRWYNGRRRRAMLNRIKKLFCFKR